MATDDFAQRPLPTIQSSYPAVIFKSYQAAKGTVYHRITDHAHTESNRVGIEHADPRSVVCKKAAAEYLEGATNGERGDALMGGLK